jgi:hypothetical protein
MHGTRVLRLNGGAATIHALMADGGPLGVSISPSEIQEGQSTSAEVTVAGLDESCEVDAETACFPEVVVLGPQGQEVGWAYFDLGGNPIWGMLSPPVGAAGTYSVYADLCADFLDPDEWGSCTSGFATLTVVAAPPQCGYTAVTLYQPDPYPLDTADLTAATQTALACLQQSVLRAGA